MDLTFLLRGLIFGFSIAAPVGPIGVLVIRRSLAQGRLVGLASGLGAATADLFYGAAAALGLTAVSTFLIDQGVWLRLIGGVFLIYLGVRTFVAPPAAKAAEAEGKGLPGAYLSTVFLTLTNPATILAFVAIFAGLGVGDTGGDIGSALLLVVGVALGSAVWWLILSWGVSLFRGLFTPTGLRWVNRLSGVIIVAFGIAALVSVWSLTSLAR